MFKLDAREGSMWESQGGLLGTVVQSCTLTVIDAASCAALGCTSLNLVRVGDDGRAESLRMEPIAGIVAEVCIFSHASGS